MYIEVELDYQHTLRVCNVFFDGKRFRRIMLVSKTLKEKFAHIESVQSFFLLVRYPLELCLFYRLSKKGLHTFEVCKLEDNKVSIRLMHTSKVCNLFFGGFSSHTYLLKGVHFGTWAQKLTLKAFAQVSYLLLYPSNLFY